MHVWAVPIGVGVIALCTAVFGWKASAWTLGVSVMDRRKGTCGKPTQNYLTGNICIAVSYSSATSASARSR